MVKEIRETLSNEEGQALVIGGLMLLLLAFGILVTLNIGRAVEEKIKLQNASDANAYSLAVLEAQAFNYVAFTNRVQASHYNSIMLIQGYANFLIFLEGMLGTFVDYIWTFTTVLSWIANILSVIPPVAAIGKALQKVGDMLYKVGNFIYKLTLKLRNALYGDEENIDGGLIPLMGGLRRILWYVNYAQYFTEAIYSGLITIKIIGGMKNMSDQNLGANEINMTGGKAEATNKIVKDAYLAKILKLLSSGLNVIEYYQTFDAVGGRPLMPKLPNTDDGLRALKSEDDSPKEYDHFKDRDKTLRANQRLMAEIANATRSERDGNWAQKWLANNTRRGFRLPGDLSLGGFEDVLEKFIDIRVEGQTKLATYLAEPKSVSWLWNEDFLGESVVRQLEEKSRGTDYPFVNTDRRTFNLKNSSDDEGKDYKHYKLNNDSKKVRVDMYRPTGDVMGSYEHFHFFMGLQIDALSFLGLGKITLAECDIYPAIVSDRNGGRIYRWRLPEDWIVDLMDNTWTRLYLRVPGSVWDLLGLFQMPINMCAAGTLIPIVAGLPFFGCKSVSDPATEGCNGYKIKIWFIKIKVKCTWLPGFCCKLRKWLDQMTFKTFEKITQEDSNDNLNQWWLGIGPFMRFKPDFRRSTDFNQPSTWTILNSPPENFMDGNVWNLNDSGQQLSTKGIFKNKCEDGSYDATNDTCNVVARERDLSVNPLIDDDERYRDSSVLGIGSVGLFGPGLNVISRARVYYHRPGNWEEPPNFMNPFWRAQLAPIAQKLVPYLRTLQQKLDKILEPISSALGGINTGIDTIDNIASGLQGIVDMLRTDGLTKILIGMIAH